MQTCYGSRDAMCNLNGFTKGQQAIRDITRAMIDRTGNLLLFPGIFPTTPRRPSAIAQRAARLSRDLRQHYAVSSATLRDVSNYPLSDLSKISRSICIYVRRIPGI